MRALAVVLVLTACGEPEFSGPTIQVSGSVIEWRTVGYRPVAPDIQICVYNVPSLPCATTDQDGKYVLERVPVGETALIYSGELFTTGVGVITTTEGQDLVGNFAILSRTDLKLLAATAGVQLEPGTGLMNFELGQTPGIVAHLDPPAGIGPVYHNNDNIPDPTQVATTYDARGEYGNLPPGEYTVTFERLNTTFTARLPFAWARPNGSAFPVVPDSIAGINMDVH